MHGITQLISPLRLLILHEKWVPYELGPAHFFFESRGQSSREASESFDPLHGYVLDRQGVFGVSAKNLDTINELGGYLVLLSELPHILTIPLVLRVFLCKSR